MLAGARAVRPDKLERVRGGESIPRGIHLDRGPQHKGSAKSAIVGHLRGGDGEVGRPVTGSLRNANGGRPFGVDRDVSPSAETTIISGGSAVSLVSVSRNQVPTRGCTPAPSGEASWAEVMAKPSTSATLARQRDGQHAVLRRGMQWTRKVIEQPAHGVLSSLVVDGHQGSRTAPTIAPAVSEHGAYCHDPITKGM